MNFDKLADKMQARSTALRGDLLEQLAELEREVAENLTETRSTICAAIDPLIGPDAPSANPDYSAPTPSPPPIRDTQPARESRWWLLLILAPIALGWVLSDCYHRVSPPAPGPRPIPVPDPSPSPLPTPDPIVTYPGSWILVIRQTEKLDADWAIMKGDAKYWSELESRGLHWRYYDDEDDDAKRYVERLTTMRVPIPALVIISNNGTLLLAQPCPSTVDQLDALVKKSTGL